MLDIHALAQVRLVRPNTIVWCSGFARDYSWIEMPVAGPDGYPRHTGGVADGKAGLYFVGLPFQTRLASALIGGVGEDARFIAATIAGRRDRSAAEQRGELQEVAGRDLRVGVG